MLKAADAGNVVSTDLPGGIETTRQAALDALRASLTLLVVMHHSAITYGAIGGWFYREVPTDGSLSSTLLVYFCTVNQAFFMGLFFLLAGYLTPASLERHGALRFTANRLLRLGVPMLFFGWFLGPVTIAIAQTSLAHPFAATLMRLLRAGTFEIGPLWFAEALLIFSGVAQLWANAPPGGRLRSLHSAAPRPWPSAWPSDTALLAAALATGAGALALRVYWPVGASVLGMQLGYFASYVVLFAFGAIAAGHDWLESLPSAKVQTWWRVACVALPALPIVYFLGRAVPELRGSTLACVYAFWEPLVAWGVILKLLFEYQRRFAVPSRFWSALGRRAYTVYIIHPPVLVAVAVAWRVVPANALLKFMVTGALSCALCFVIAGGLLRLPTLRKLL